MVGVVFGSVFPVRFHAYKQVKSRIYAPLVLDIMSRRGANFFKLRPTPTNNNFFMCVTLHNNFLINIQNTRIIHINTFGHDVYVIG